MDEKGESIFSLGGFGNAQNALFPQEGRLKGLYIHRPGQHDRITALPNPLAFGAPVIFGLIGKFDVADNNVIFLQIGLDDVHGLLFIYKTDFDEGQAMEKDAFLYQPQPDEDQHDQHEADSDNPVISHPNRQTHAGHQPQGSGGGQAFDGPLALQDGAGPPGIRCR